ncbi:MAG: CD225/dispanin family protein [Synechococcales cyanobacterium RM1_1_8]|nr:CD225/dispanin family protein [Synechococcales cyanobacterium RM1_1_8]
MLGPICNGGIFASVWAIAQGQVQDWELAISNDFSLDEAKLKLQALEGQQQAESLASHIAQQLQTQLDPGGSTPVVEIASLLRVQLQFQASQLTVQVHHPLGIAINYGRWAETIRQALVQRPQKEIYRFRMELYGEGSRFLEWSQTGNIYQGEPCPPSHWSWVVLTTLLVFPLGLPAAVFAWRTEQLFEAGDYLEAQRTSKTALGLCRLGVGLAGVVAIAAAGYGLFALVQPEHFRRLESGPVESGPVESGPRLEQGGDRERPAVQN